MSLIPIVQGGHSVASGFNTTLIGNSVWFDSGDYLDQDTAAADSSRKEAIFSTWLQRSKFGEQGMFMCVNGSSSTDYLVLDFQADDTLRLLAYDVTILVTSQVFRDVGWYHILVTIDTSQNSNSSQKIFVNGEEVTSFSTRNNFGSSANIGWGRNQTHLVNSSPTSVGSNQMIGYMAQTALITDKSFQQGDYSITDFVDAFTIGTNGSQFVPKKNADIATIVGAGGNNSFLLTYENSSDLGNDGSSKNNDFSDNSMGSANQSSNTPSLVYPTLNPLAQNSTGVTLSQGNLGVARSSSSQGLVSSTMGMSSGKFYCEVTINDSSNFVVGLVEGQLLSTANRYLGQDSNTYGYDAGGQKVTGGSYSSYGTSYTSGDVVSIIFDADAGKLYFGKDGTVQNSGNPVDGTNFAFENLTDGPYFFAASAENVSSANVFNFGQSSFAHTPPTGFVALNSSNLTAPTHFGCDAFQNVTYTGNGSTRSITTDIAPAWVWIKNRSQGDEHKLVDVVRGATKELVIDGSTAEQTDSNGVTAFSSSSFSLGSGANGYNDSSENFVAWCWAAGTAFSNDASATGIGTLDSSGRVNASDSLSIVSYTGSGANASIKHGLSAAPEMYIVRDRTAGNDWNVYSADANASPASGSLRLDNGADFLADPTIWNGVPSSTVVNLGTSDETNKLNNAFVAYCFRSVPGVCKIGTYVGNGSGSGTADGPYVSCGFRPAIVFQKWVTGGSLSGENWVVKDTARQPLNENRTDISPSSAGAESTGATHGVDILADGFKLRGGGGANNKSGATYLYLAMADIGGGGTLPPIYGR